MQSAYHSQLHYESDGSPRQPQRAHAALYPPPRPDTLTSYSPWSTAHISSTHPYAHHDDQPAHWVPPTLPDHYAPPTSSSLYHPDHLFRSSSRPRSGSYHAVPSQDLGIQRHASNEYSRIIPSPQFDQDRERSPPSPGAQMLSQSNIPPSPTNGTRPYTCPTCPMSFARAHDLKRHRDTHTQDKKHSCPYCGKTLSRKDALKRHVLSKQCPAEGGKDGIWPPPPGFVRATPSSASPPATATVTNGANGTNGAAAAANAGSFAHGRTLPALQTLQQTWPVNPSQGRSSIPSPAATLRDASYHSSTSPSTHTRGQSYPYSDARSYNPYSQS